MASSTVTPARVSAAWRRATFALAAALILSWAVLGYAVVDGGISLSYCRAEQEHQKADIRTLVEASKGRLTSETYLAARASMDPALPHKLEEGGTLLLRTLTLQFGADGVLRGIAEEP
jgi:hypothetical protein